jgi:hypothetical protein
MKIFAGGRRGPFGKRISIVGKSNVLKEVTVMEVVSVVRLLT